MSETAPDPLPPAGWELRASAKYPGHSFYLHLASGRTQWTVPKGMSQQHSSSMLEIRLMSADAAQTFVFRGCGINTKLKPAFGAGPVGEWDHDGVLYDIATEGGRSAWVNPHTGGRGVVAAWSSQDFKGRSAHESFVSGPQEQPRWSVTKDLPESWMRVDLGSLRRLAVEHYALRTESWGGGLVGNRDLRNWELQGAACEDGPWTMLRRHDNDEALDRQTQPVASWAVEGAAAWRYLRVLQTGFNAHGNNELSCSGVEFWGKLNEVAELKTLRVSFETKGRGRMSAQVEVVPEPQLESQQESVAVSQELGLPPAGFGARSAPA
jgi:hypothetical protein